jgi:hypothetical protein
MLSDVSHKFANRKHDKTTNVQCAEVQIPSSRKSTAMLTQNASGFLKFKNVCDDDGPRQAARIDAPCSRCKSDSSRSWSNLLLLANMASCSSSTSSGEFGSENDVGRVSVLDAGRGHGGKSLKTCLAMYKSRQQEVSML